MSHSRYCLVHHLDISFDIINATHFSIPPTSPSLPQQPPYLRWHTTNGLSPMIMNEVFNFQENKRFSLRSGIHLANGNMDIGHFGIDTISSLTPKL